MQCCPCYIISSGMAILIYLLVQVLEILSHVNKRVKHQPEIGLPLSDLWRIYTEANAVSIVKNFCILYIEMAFERTDVKVRYCSMVSEVSLENEKLLA